MTGERSMGARRRRLRDLPVNSLIPNIFTVLALCSGLSAIRFALLERWELAVAAILVAGILDGLDGRLARLLKGTSKFGAELDSLSDFVSFGVAPAVTLYLWTLEGLGGFGWILVLAFAVSCALRLARFNTALEDPDRPAWTVNFFTGVAAPSGAAISLLFMVMSFFAGEEVFRHPALNAAWIVLMAFLMISQLPTYSFKKIRVRRQYIMPMLLVVGLVAALLVSYPWQFLSCIGIAYLATIPFSLRSYSRLARQDAEGARE